MNFFIRLRNILLTCFSLILFQAAFSQTVEIRGNVHDSISGRPLSNVSILAGRKTLQPKAISDSAGNFHFRADQSNLILQFSLSGFNTVTLSLQGKSIHGLNILMAPGYENLAAVSVTGSTKRYTNKNNPAVELIREVIAHKDRNDLGAYAGASFQQYQKMVMYLDKFPDWISHSRFLKKYSFVFDNKDSSKVDGKTLTPFYVEETVSNNYLRNDPHEINSVPFAQKKVDYGEFVDTKGIGAIFNRIYANIDIYQSKINLFSRDFISPIADIGPTLYKYFIRDTVIEDGNPYTALAFEPRNPYDLLFNGILYISADTNYSVKRVTMDLNSHINLGLVRNLDIDQKFERDAQSRYHLAVSQVIADFGFTDNGIGLLGEKTLVVQHFTPDSTINPVFFEGKKYHTLEEIPAMPDSFWVAHRPQALSKFEINAYKNIDTLHNMKSYKNLANFTTMLAAGYYSIGNIEIGPVQGFLTYNPVEGFKPRFGGRTSTHFSSRYYLEGYTAYGLTDHQWKYYGRITYALNNKSVYTYPLHFLQASYRFDTSIPGLGDEYVEENILYSIRKGANDKYLYNRIFRLDYLHEMGNHLSLSLGFKVKTQSPAGSLNFIKQESVTTDTVPSITTGEIGFRLRWAPHEEFYQTKINRSLIINKYPVFNLTYIQGIKGLFGGQYNYQYVNFSAFKRIYIPPLGFSQVTFDAGYLFGQVPWPLLVIHSGNQSFVAARSGFNMMNYLEFVSDHYTSLAWDHYFKGFFFNRIPLLKKLKLQEVIGGRILYGGVRAENLPGTGQYKFPTTSGINTTFTLNGDPYIEVSAGVAHIFKVLRVDIVKRLTYLQDPGISKLSFRVGFNVSF